MMSFRTTGGMLCFSYVNSVFKKFFTCFFTLYVHVQKWVS